MKNSTDLIYKVPNPLYDEEQPLYILSVSPHLIETMLEAAWITGFNEKTIYGYRKGFFENHGVFKEERRGGNTREFACSMKSLCTWTQQCMYEKKGAPTLVARNFRHWVNNELLPSSDLPPNVYLWYQEFWL